VDEKKDTKTNQTSGQVQLPRQEPNLASKFSISGLLRRGESQYNPMPKEQKFTLPSESAYVPNTPLPTGPKILDQTASNKTPKNWFEVKIILLVIALLIGALLIISASLYYTNYFIYTPPAPVKNLIEAVFTKVPKASQITLPFNF